VKKREDLHSNRGGEKKENFEMARRKKKNRALIQEPGRGGRDEGAQHEKVGERQDLLMGGKKKNNGIIDPSKL